jgi:hypothetical protein
MLLNLSITLGCWRLEVSLHRIVFEVDSVCQGEQIMRPLLINQSNMSRDFFFRLSKRLEEYDLAIFGLTGIGPIRKISVLNMLLNLSITLGCWRLEVSLHRIVFEVDSVCQGEQIYQLAVRKLRKIN